MDSDNKGKQNGFIKALSYLSHVGITIIACVAVGILLGRFLDSLLSTTPWLLIVCALLGIGAAIKSICDIGSSNKF